MEMEGYDGTAQEDWASHLPSFANKANRDLDAYIKRVRQELEYTDVSLENNEDRIKVMSEHLANVQAELKYTQSRFNAKTNEIQTEDHLKQLSNRQGVRIAPSSTPPIARPIACPTAHCLNSKCNLSTIKPCTDLTLSIQLLNSKKSLQQHQCEMCVK